MFLLCVTGFSVATCFSNTAETYLRDRNPRIWCWNWTLFVFAAVLANIVRLPLGISDTTLAWLANLGICVASGAAVFFAVLVTAIAYHIFWPLFKTLLRPED
ncbi:MAG: hypothetical protein IJ532_02420 [Alphaproteobacteria bacterium]|nr:hypothetical protein [Alphaproteobacteria bacterium]